MVDLVACVCDHPPPMPPPKERVRQQTETGDTQDLCQALDSLTAIMTRIADELQGIREDLDAIRDDFGWGLSNDKFGLLPQRTPLSSTPLEPLASEAEEILNTSNSQEPSDETPADGLAKQTATTQRALWDA